MNILIAGDFFISDEYRNKDLIDQSVLDIFQNADYRIINLEVPITADNPKNKILKTGPHLRTSEETVIPYLKQLKVDALTLANNHILDYGTKGLTDTFGTLKNNQIDFVGAGNNLEEATKPLSLERDGMSIAILNFAENEWSIAEDDKPGANPLDIIDNVNQIKAAKVTHDKVICIIHGAHEYYHLPSMDS
jgi:poly-gamma-glutamate capsule biosynthesis protein CapA/YwtB (metallophosphatase superfamily)